MYKIFYYIWKTINIYPYLILCSLLKFENNSDMKILIFVHLNLSQSLNVIVLPKVGVILDSCHCFQEMKLIHEIEFFCFVFICFHF